MENPEPKATKKAGGATSKKDKAKELNWNDFFNVTKLFMPKACNKDESGEIKELNPKDFP